MLSAVCRPLVGGQEAAKCQQWVGWLAVSESERERASERKSERESEREQEGSARWRAGSHSVMQVPYSPSPL